MALAARCADELGLTAHDDAFARRFGERGYSTTMTPHGNSAANVA